MKFEDLPGLIRDAAKHASNLDYDACADTLETAYALAQRAADQYTPLMRNEFDVICFPLAIHTRHWCELPLHQFNTAVRVAVIRANLGKTLRPAGMHDCLKRAALWANVLAGREAVYTPAVPVELYTVEA